jgi:hypothetical protein
MTVTAAAAASPLKGLIARYSKSGPPRIAQFGSKARPGVAVPKLKKPPLFRNPATLNAAKAKAEQALRNSAAPMAPTLPPRVAAPLAPTPLLETLTSFPAMGLEQQVADMGRGQVTDPANTQVGVSPNQVVEVVNANMSVWTKSGARVDTQDLGLLFSLPSGFAIADPNILYDTVSGRWFLSFSAFNAAYDSRVYVAASQTSDATGTWYIYTLAVKAGVLMDQPLLGNGDQVMTMVWGDFATPCSPACTYTGDEMYAIEKSQLMAGTTPLDHATTPTPDQTRFGIVPARSLNSTTTEYLVWNNSDPTNLMVQTTLGPTVGLIAIAGQPALHNVTFTELATPTITPTTAPPRAQQPNGERPLETGDDRLLSAVWQNNTLWTAANEACPGSTTSGCIRLLKLDTNAGTVVESELGTPSDFVYNPAVSMDGSGTLFVAYNESNTNVYPQLVATTGSGAPTAVVMSGTAAIDPNLCGLAPWRSYSGAAADPSDAGDIWVAGAYGANSTDLCDWHSAIGRLTRAAPTVTGFSPAAVPQGGGRVVDVTGSEFVPGGTSVQFPSGPGTNVNVVSPNELTAVVPASATSLSGAVTVTTANGTASSAGLLKMVPYVFSPAPIAPNGTLTGSTSINVTLTPTGATPSYLSFSGPGTACVGASCLTGTPTLVPPTAGQITIQYTTPSSLPTSGAAAITVQDAPSSPTNTLTDTYTFTRVVNKLALSTSPTIAPTGDLVAGMSVRVMLTATDVANSPIAGASISFTFQQASGGGSASVAKVALTASAQRFTTDANGQIAIVYGTPATLPTAGGTDTIAATAAGGANDHDTYTFPPVTTFYFAEGFTAGGFTEVLSLLMPNESGTVVIDYYSQLGHGQSIAFLTQGAVELVDVGATIGINQQVSMKVTLPGPGVAERTLHFSFGSWHGSTSIIGLNAPSTQWNFAEGSTLSFFSEYLTLQNPSASPALVTLKYFTDVPATATKTLTLPGNTRTTVAVFDGDLTTPAGACAISGGNAVHCGVGSGIAGVSVKITSNVAIIAERPFYVNNFSFGDGPIRDGHVAFGATNPGTEWDFAEGTTLRGFKEYLTLQNPNPTAAHANLQYLTDVPNTNPLKSLTLPANSRTTVEVFSGDRNSNPSCTAGVGGSCGIGLDIAGVSLKVTADQPIVAERPMYMSFNFGSGSVAGAHDVVGATTLGRLFGFAYASTLAGDNDYLTIENQGNTTANIVATYFTGAGATVRTFGVAPSSRHTVGLFSSAEGPGPGYYPLGIEIESDQPVLVEKPTYSRNATTFGATDTLGYTPTGF